jgi:SRSO17 transposase
MDGLAQAAGHADRATPLKMYCAGLLLPGERCIAPDGLDSALEVS